MAHAFILPALKPGDTVHNFTVTRVTPLPDMNFHAYELKHPKSGARMLHIAADDPENLFSVAFRTPPEDDTGLPHILEHSVLCGSKRYPVKDPFVELLKTSLATFLNAFTYPDRTCYPCASMNPKDFHNLMRVYCDACFFPTLSEDHFRQEGHHYEFNPDGNLAIKGVVYNEMRGAYSSPDRIMMRHVEHILFASNAYGKDSGGDPKAIPQLTYQQYLNFHKSYYHPSNSWIFTYGDVALTETLEILDSEYLGKFDAISLDSTIKPLVRWTAPQTASFTYPIDREDSQGSRTDIAVTYATNDRRDVLDNLAMDVIDLYLLDNAASPLRKALIDSKLGEELGSSGHYDYQRDTLFQITLKGSEPERAQAVEDLILDVIRRECANGFDKEKVESALHQLELASREIRPEYPIDLLERVFAAWLYDTDPLSQVDIALDLDNLRQTIRENPNYLEAVAKRWLVDNPHRLRMTLIPDVEFVEKTESEYKARLDATLAKMSEAEKKKVAETAERLEEMQSEGNSPEALATLPRLALSDLSPDPLPLDHETAKVAGFDFLTVPMYSGGIGYLDLGMRLSGLSDDEVMLLPFFCNALGKIGAAGLNYADMASREAASIGALDFVAGLTPHVDGADKAVLRMTAWLKALDPDWEKALGILTDRLFRADWHDIDRLRDIILQSRMSWRNRIVPSGHSYASLYAAQSVTPALTLAERLSGCTQARYIDKLANSVSDKDGLMSLANRLAALGQKILAGATPSASTIGPDASVALSRRWLEENAGQFTGRGQMQPLPQPVTAKPRIGLAAPSEVSYAAVAMPAPAMSDPDAAALVLLGMQLRFGFLWNEIRVKGGAYGAFATYDGARGSFNFASYRDPNILRTLASFAASADFIAKDMDLSADGLEQAIIGATKNLDTPKRPPTAVVTALTRHLSGETEEFRKQFRSRLLGLTKDDVRSAAAKVFAHVKDSPVCVLSSRERLEEENKIAGDMPFAIEPLWE